MRKKRRGLTVRPESGFLNSTSNNSARNDERERPFDDSFSFLNRDDLVGFCAAEFRCIAAWPNDFDGVHGWALTQTKMQAGILRGLVAHAAFPLIVESQIAGDNLDASADRVTIGPGADQKDLKPVVLITSVIAKELRRLSVVADKDVEVAVVVKVGHGSTATDERHLEIRAQRIADIFEDTVSVVTEHQLGFGVAGFWMVFLDVVEDVTVCHEEVASAVIVVVEKAGAKTTDPEGGVGKF